MGRLARPLRRLAVGAALAALPLTVVPLAASPAAATGGELLVSADGIHFSPLNTLPLFPEQWRLVPGDAVTTSLWVRNAGAHPGRLRIDLIDPHADDTVLAAHLALAATVGPDPAGAVDFSAALDNGACTVLVGSHLLTAGETARLEVIARMSPSLESDQGARGTVGFRLRGILSDPAADTSDRPGAACAASIDPSTDPSSAPLSATGGSGETAAIVAGVGITALVAGAAVFGASRRRQEEER